jgi:Secretion system C-terminal sorting domain
MKLAIILLSALAMSQASSQNNITGHVESVPSQTNVRARISFVNTATQEKLSVLTDTVSGNYLRVLSSGNWIMTINSIGHFLYDKDTVSVGGNTTNDKQMIADSGKTYSDSPDFLNAFKMQTSTRNADPRQVTHRFYTTNIDYANTNNPPSNWFLTIQDSAFSNFTQRTTILEFSKQTQDVTRGLSILYEPFISFGGWGLTERDGFDLVNGITHATITIANENNSVTLLPTYMREIWTGLGFERGTTDNTSVGAQAGTVVSTLNDVDALILKVAFRLRLWTDMSKYFETIIASVPNQAPSAPSLVSPANSDTTQSIGRLVFFKWSTSLDPDNDQVFYVLRVAGPGLDTTINKMTDTTTSIAGNEFQLGQTYDWNVTATDNWAWNSSATKSFTMTRTDEVEGLEEIARIYSLEQNYPNPFNPSTTIRYGIPMRSNVSLIVYNTLGQRVAALVQGQQEAGSYEVKLDASELASGVYFYRLQAGTYVETKKLLLLR